MLVRRLLICIFANRAVYCNLGIVVDIIYMVVLIQTLVNIRTSLYKLISGQSLVAGTPRTATPAWKMWVGVLFKLMVACVAYNSNLVTRSCVHGQWIVVCVSVLLSCNCHEFLLSEPRVLFRAFLTSGPREVVNRNLFKYDATRCAMNTDLVFLIDIVFFYMFICI